MTDTTSVDAPTTPEVEVTHDDPDAPATGQGATEETSEEPDAPDGHEGDHDAEHGEHEHPTDNNYITIALILAVITAAEVAASYLDLGPAFIPLLLFMMAMKFFIVVSFFMHLRFDNRVFTWLFYSGLFLALGVYVATMFTFGFFGG